MAITDLEIRMTIKTLAAKGVPNGAIARQLSLAEGTVQYHLPRLACGAIDGRARQARRASPFHGAIDHWFAQRADSAVNLAALHAWLVNGHGYTGSLRSIQRYVSESHPPPPRRARRRVETPPDPRHRAAPKALLERRRSTDPSDTVVRIEDLALTEPPVGPLGHSLSLLKRRVTQAAKERGSAMACRGINSEMRQ